MTQLATQTNPEPTHSEIALLAYSISQSTQGQHRSAMENWLEAERTLKTKRFEALANPQKQPPALKSKKSKQQAAKK